jgi:hypothetical protein
MSHKAAGADCGFTIEFKIKQADPETEQYPNWRQVHHNHFKVNTNTITGRCVFRITFYPY